MTADLPGTPATSDELVQLVAAAMGWPVTSGTGMGIGADPQVYAEGLRQSVEAVLAAVRPLIEADLRERIAAEIEKECIDPEWPSDDISRNGQAAAAIARDGDL